MPYGFKRVGWVLLATSLLVAIWAVSLDFNYEKSELLRSLQMEGTLITNYIVFGLWLGVIFVGCSRERIEDEMISRIRLNALLVGFYIQALFILVATFVFNSLDYLDVMIYNLVSFPLIFLVAYRWLLWRSRKEVCDGE